MANIRTARRSGLVLRGGRNRRESLWLDIAPSLATQAAAGGIITNALNAAALALRPFTIVRTRMSFFIRSDQAAAAEVQTAAYGIAVVSSQAEAVGITAVPTPITDLSSDLWFFHQFLLADESRLTDVAKPGQVVHADSKAMRKVEDQQDLAVVLEMSTITQGVTVNSMGRLLIKLH